MVDNLLKESQKTHQVDIMMSENDIDINFLKICGVHLSRETAITTLQLHEFSKPRT